MIPPLYPEGAKYVFATARKQKLSRNEINCFFAPFQRWKGAKDRRAGKNGISIGLIYRSLQYIIAAYSAIKLHHYDLRRFRRSLLPDPTSFNTMFASGKQTLSARAKASKSVCFYCNSSLASRTTRCAYNSGRPTAAGLRDDCNKVTARSSPKSERGETRGGRQRRRSDPTPRQASDET